MRTMIFCVCFVFVALRCSGELTSVDLQGKCTEIEARLDSSDLQLAENAIGMIGSK